MHPNVLAMLSDFPDQFHHELNLIVKREILRGYLAIMNLQCLRKRENN